MSCSTVYPNASLLHMPQHKTKREIVLALALETGADLRTVTRWLDGLPVTPVTSWALRKCSEQLGLAKSIQQLTKQAEGA